ncbi:hypothetical protein AVEN_95302-1 [Araneus ventricosus]|uniref:Uncharacterized protein n=1 Tax=Araneus ventricosus TaxID=182803 RepID=A0A4Y2KLD7_ARAVE|nr:hypothetical protein AVEN_95302-1 [Araneus ventricosus]
MSCTCALSPTEKFLQFFCATVTETGLFCRLINLPSNLLPSAEMQSAGATIFEDISFFPPLSRRHDDDHFLFAMNHAGVKRLSGTSAEENVRLILWNDNIGRVPKLEAG